MNPNSEVRVVHDKLGAGWTQRGLRASGEHEACDLVWFKNGTLAYVPVRELHSFGAHPSHGAET